MRFLQCGHTGKIGKEIQWPVPALVYLQGLLDVRLQFKYRAMVINSLGVKVWSWLLLTHHWNVYSPARDLTNCKSFSRRKTSFWLAQALGFLASRHKIPGEVMDPWPLLFRSQNNPRGGASGVYLIQECLPSLAVTEPFSALLCLVWEARILEIHGHQSQPKQRLSDSRLPNSKNKITDHARVISEKKLLERA